MWSSKFFCVATLGADETVVEFDATVFFFFGGELNWCHKGLFGELGIGGGRECVKESGRKSFGGCVWVDGGLVGEFRGTKPRDIGIMVR